MVDAWADTAEVLDITTRVVDDATVTVAQGHIELACGRLYMDNDRIGARDLHWLQRAVAYQAAWLAAQPDWAERIEITADGSASSATQYAPNALRLGPYAKQALSRVSWVRSRGLQVLSPDEYTTANNDPEDMEPGWSPWQRVDT